MSSSQWNLLFDGASNELGKIPVQSVVTENDNVVDVIPSGIQTLGQNVDVIQIQNVAVQSTGITITGQSVEVFHIQKVDVTPAIFAISGQSVDVKHVQNIDVNPSLVTLSGQNVGIGITEIINVLPSKISLKNLLTQVVIKPKKGSNSMAIYTQTTAMISQKELSKLRENRSLWTRLKNVCDNQINDAPSPVEVFNPDGIYSTTTGINPIKDLFYFDCQKVYRHGLCYQITGDAKYAIKAQEIIDAWVNTLSRVEGNAAQGYFNFQIGAMVIGGAWVRGANNWSGDDFEEWLVKKFLILSRSYRPNNIGAWGLFMETSIASYSKNIKMLEQCSKKWQTQVMTQINPEGIMEEEVERTGPDEIVGESGISYSNFGMLAWVLSSETLKKEGFDVYSTLAGKRLEIGYKKIAGWVLKPSTFPYYSGPINNMTSPWQVTYFYVLNKYFTDTNAVLVTEQIQKQLPNAFILDFMFGNYWNPTAEIKTLG
ncbi:alginate lyase [Caudoviricetes sp.]|nr:alginate lyase [Caudoviricetes sp.]